MNPTRPAREEVEYAASQKGYWCSNFRAIDIAMRTVDAYLELEAENAALRKQVEKCNEAIKNEPELPGEMPEGMMETISDVGIEETMRVVVRETKKNILQNAGFTREGSDE